MRCTPVLFDEPFYRGFADEEAAEEEAAKAKQGGSEAYAQADVVVALGGWDENAAKPAAEGALRALKALLEADKELPSSCSELLKYLILHSCVASEAKT